MTELDEALQLRSAGSGEWETSADPRYASANGMYGGWTAAISLSAVCKGVRDEAKPSAMTVNFVDRVEPGSQLTVRAQRVGGSRSISHWQSELRQRGWKQPLALSSVVMSLRPATDGFTSASMPHAPDPETLEMLPLSTPQGQRAIVRPVSGNPPYGRNDTRSVHWVRDRSGRPVDHVQLAYLSDQMIPRAFFWSDAPRPNATMTLSLYFYATDEEMSGVGDDYILNEAVGTRGVASISGHHARLWSRQGALLGTTEQLCWYR